MHRGSVGDTDVSEDEYLPRDTSRSNENLNRRRSARIVQNFPSTSRAARGSSRRKNKPPSKQSIRALKEIAKFQKSTELLIPKLPFGRLVREITLDVNQEITRYTVAALQALQEATEMFIIQMLQDANYLTLHRKRITLSKADILLIRLLKLNF